MFKKFAMKYLNKDDYANSYEKAMKDEFDKMKNSFLSKINKLTKEYDDLRKDNLRV
jgi:hypothetical protein